MTDQITISPEEDQYFELFDPLVRDFKATDLNFIRRTWLRSFRHECTQTSNNRYYTKQHRLIDRLMQNDDTRLTVLCDSAHEDYIVGFLICNVPPENHDCPLILHYAFVKRAYRQQGLFKQMLKAMHWYEGRSILCTHWTRFLYPISRRMKLECDEWILKEITFDGDYIREKDMVYNNG